jgi:hypothetical protein
LKELKGLILSAVLFAIGFVAPFAANAGSEQGWHAFPPFQAGNSFDSMGIQWLSGGTFATPALTLDSGATGWTQANNALIAYASFDSTTDLYFSTHLNAPGTFAWFAWSKNALVDSALLQSGQSQVVQYPYLGSAPSRVEFAAAVPEPETYAMMLAGLGLMGFIARRRKGRNAA